MLSQEEEAELLDKFPKVEFAFAYGSGAIQQGGYNYTVDDEGANLPMLDLILVVDDPVQWHRENIQMNRDHYTPLVPLSPTIISMVQNFSAGLWYNSLIKMNIKKYRKRQMKYGVISTKKLLADLNEWRSLYVAGRLHKPIHILKHNDTIENAMARNKEYAVRTALLLVPKLFDEFDLFTKIASLSYTGDPRMIVGENPKKVVNLVTPIIPIYRKEYEQALLKVASEIEINNLIKDSPLSQTVHHSDVKTDSTTYKMYTQTMTSDSRWRLCENLPVTMRNILLMNRRTIGSPPKKHAIRSAVSAIVYRAAVSQSVKGIITAGVMKGSSYLFKKVTKKFPILSNLVRKHGI